MFSQACVKNTVHRGRHAWQGGRAWQGAYVAGGSCVAGGACMAGGVHGRGNVWQGACMAGGCAWQGGMHERGACIAGGCAAAIAAGGMHPTGMHSFLGYYLLVLCACSKSSIIRNIYALTHCNQNKYVRESSTD